MRRVFLFGEEASCLLPGGIHLAVFGSTVLLGVDLVTHHGQGLTAPKSLPALTGSGLFPPFWSPSLQSLPISFLPKNRCAITPSEFLLLACWETFHHFQCSQNEVGAPYRTPTPRCWTPLCSSHRAAGSHRRVTCLSLAAVVRGGLRVSRLP